MIHNGIDFCPRNNPTNTKKWELKLQRSALSLIVPYLQHSSSKHHHELRHPRYPTQLGCCIRPPVYRPCLHRRQRSQLATKRIWIRIWIAWKSSPGWRVRSPWFCQGHSPSYHVTMAWGSKLLCVLVVSLHSNAHNTLHFRKHNTDALPCLPCLACWLLRNRLSTTHSSRLTTRILDQPSVSWTRLMHKLHSSWLVSSACGFCYFCLHKYLLNATNMTCMCNKHDKE